MRVTDNRPSGDNQLTVISSPQTDSVGKCLFHPRRALFVTSLQCTTLTGLGEAQPSPARPCSIEFLESDLIGVLPEAAAADIQSILADESVCVGTAPAAAKIQHVTHVPDPGSGSHSPDTRSRTELLRMRIPDVLMTHGDGSSDSERRESGGSRDTEQRMQDTGRPEAEAVGDVSCVQQRRHQISEREAENSSLCVQVV